MLGFANPISEAAEVAFVDCGRAFRRGAIEQKITQAFAIQIGANQLANTFTARGMAALGYLIFNEALQGAWQLNVHRAHDEKGRQCGKTRQDRPMATSS